jgi:hypothetical protein
MQIPPQTVTQTAAQPAPQPQPQATLNGETVVDTNQASR